MKKTTKAKKRVSKEAKQEGQKEAVQGHPHKEHSPAASAPLVMTITRSPGMVSVEGHLAFKTADNRELHNLLELAEALESMAEDAFHHHVTEQYNHFSNWLKECLKEEKLAEAIRHSTQKEAHTKVLRHVLHELLK
jgi:hypothetical protein